MAIIGLDHVQLAIPEGGEDRAREFYCDVLGLAEVPKPETLSPKGCWFESGSLSLHLGVDPDFRPAKKAHPALLVDDLAQSAADLKSSGFTVREDQSLAGYERIFTEDPFGNRIEIMRKL